MSCGSPSSALCGGPGPSSPYPERGRNRPSARVAPGEGCPHPSPGPEHRGVLRVRGRFSKRQKQPVSACWNSRFPERPRVWNESPQMCRMARLPQDCPELARPPPRPVLGIPCPPFQCPHRPLLISPSSPPSWLLSIRCGASTLHTHLGSVHMGRERVPCHAAWWTERRAATPPSSSPWQKGRAPLGAQRDGLVVARASCTSPRPWAELFAAMSPLCRRGH